MENKTADWKIQNVLSLNGVVADNDYEQISSEILQVIKYEELTQENERLKPNVPNKSEFIPFGEEWKKEMKKLPKDFLIDMFKKAQLEVSTLTEDNKKLREALEKVTSCKDIHNFRLENGGVVTCYQIPYTLMWELQSLIHSDQPKTE